MVTQGRCKIAQGFTDHEPGDSAHKTGLFGDRDENIGTYGIALFVGPARQSLRAGDAPCRQIEDRLINQPQLVS